MDLKIRGKIAFVTGSKGMARSAAGFLAGDGARVAIIAREQAGIDLAVAEIVAAGGSAIGISADLSTRDGIESAVAETMDRLGPPDIVIAQGSNNKVGKLFELDADDFRDRFEVSTVAMAHLARAVIPGMREKKWGRFIHIGTSAAREAVSEFPHMLSNTVAPSVMGLLKSLSDEFASEGITFNSVGPGWVATEMLENFYRLRIAPHHPGVSLDEWLDREFFIPAGRAGLPEEIGSFVAYLCSDLAGYCTGEWIAIDGGKHRSTI